MDTDLEKEKMLRSAGFRYHFDRMAYINRNAKKVVSVEALEDNSEEWLRQVIEEENDSGEWRFYLNQPPSRSVIQAFIAELG